MAPARSCVTLLAAAAAVPAMGVFEAPSCAVQGKGYNDPGMNKTINGNYLQSATACQDSCQATVFCSHWTWYNNTGGCWLQGDSAELTITDEQVVSGPVRCTPATEAKAHALRITDTLNEHTGAEFKWWIWMLIGLGVAALALLCLTCICCSGGEKKKKGSSRAAKLKKEAARELDLEATSAPREAMPLMGTEAQLEASVSSTCPACGNVYAADSHFCRKCGMKREGLVPPVLPQVQMSAAVPYQYLPTPAPMAYAQPMQYVAPVEPAMSVAPAPGVVYYQQ